MVERWEFVYSAGRGGFRRLRAGVIAVAVCAAACSGTAQTGPGPEAAPVTEAVSERPRVGCEAFAQDGANLGAGPRDVAAGEREAAQADTFFSAGDYTSALEAYARAIAADPLHGLAYLGKAESHLFTDNDQSAMKDALARALQILPTNPRAHLRAGDLAAEAGETKQAEAHFRCALELRPDYLEARTHLAKYLLTHGRHAEAEGVLQRAIQDAPNDVQLLILLADVLEGAHKPLEAATQAREAAARVKSSAALWRRAAALYESAGVTGEAESARALADELDPPEKERALRPLPKARERRKGK